MDLVIIGGGASGIVCAIEAAKRGLHVCILERMDRIGKKLLATGNGRCNLMNRSESCYPHGTEFANAVLEICGAKEQTEFWSGVGVNLREEDGGRVYPVSGQASTILDALRTALQVYHIDVYTGFSVERIEKKADGFIVYGNEQCIKTPKVVIAGGGNAQSKLGSNGSAAALLKGCGHTVTKQTPTLTQLVCDTKPINGLSGIRIKAIVSVLSDGKTVYRENGEVLFTDYGLSGVCIMNCSCFARSGDTIEINMVNGMGFENTQQLSTELKRRKLHWADQPLDQILCGLCVNRLSSAICKAAHVKLKDRSMSSLKEFEINQIAYTMQHFQINVKELRGFDFAQVTRGGAVTDEFDPKTMQSRKVPGLYAAGQVLDVDGICGGYNLMFAFATGIIAGRSV